MSGMILLKPGHRILRETVANVILRDEDEGKQQPLETKLFGYDRSVYHIVLPPDSTTLTIAMDHMATNEIHSRREDIKSFTAEALGERFSKFEGVTAELDVDGKDAQVAIDLSVVQQKPEDEKEDLVTAVSELKDLVFGSVFQFYFQNHQNGLEPYSFDITGDQLSATVYLVPGDARVVVVYGVHYKQKTDRAIGEIFFQKFHDTKAPGSPPTKFTTTPPDELKSFSTNTDAFGYLSFAVLEGHYKNEKKRARVTNVLQSFTSFLSYHIQMSRSYWHSKMRARAATLLKVLNRAKVEDPNAKQNKKTASGKTFKR